MFFFSTNVTAYANGGFVVELDESRCIKNCRKFRVPLFFEQRSNLDVLPWLQQMGGIDEAALDKLSLVTEMTKHIQVRASSS
jgi:hypothetical protein